MSVTGKIVNGAVVLPPGTKLPEGAAVRVETIATDDPVTFEALLRVLKPFDRNPGFQNLNGF